MQVFGIFKEVHELEYITKCYIYINKDNDEKLSVEDLNLLLKKKNKNVAGTIFLYNPCMVPLGYKKDEKLLDQGFMFKEQFYELDPEESIRILGRAMKNYKGKLIEVKYLFNYNKENIQPTSALEVFDMDLDKLYTNQLTVFAKKDNYHDYKNISYNGKFIFFGWGHKFEKHHSGIMTYAVNIAQWALKQGKEIGFLYDGVQDKDDCFEYVRFISPGAPGKLKQIMPAALEKVFSKDTVEPLSIKDML